MNYKVGQRVRVIRPENFPECLNAEAIIVGRRSGHDDAWNISIGGDGYWAHSYQLAPLTDPKADAFLKSIRKWKPYEEPRHIEEFGTFTRETWERLKAKP